MAMDYVPIQGTALPCDQIFSSSGEASVKKVDCIQPVLVEVCQMVRFFHNKLLLDFLVSHTAERDLEVVFKSPV